jgi:hypothetical protein
MMKMTTTTTTRERTCRPGYRRLTGGGLWPAAATACLFCAVAAPVTAAAGPAPKVAMKGPNCGKPPAYYAPMEPQGPPQSRVRVANFYLNQNGTPGAALDFYDSSQPGKKDKPLISGLRYGQLSAYVSPRAGSNPKYVTTDYGDLYLFQQGCQFPRATVDGMQSGTGLQEGGWVKGQQATIVISDGFDGLAPYPSFQTINEVEPKGQGYSMVLKPPRGMGMLIVNTSGLVNGTGKIGNAYLRVDGQCPDNVLVGGQTPSNSNSHSPALLGNSSADNFPYRPGSHKLEVVASSSPGLGLSQSQCNSARSLATATVKISSSSPTMLFIYGADPQHAKFLATTVG